MRVVGGTFRGRPLASPDHPGLRPTSDRVRESVFNILAHGAMGRDLDGAKVLDLFSGTGALGIEALSRGAAYCLFVEEDADARALIRRNIEALGLSGITKVFRRDATDLGDVVKPGPYDVAFLDPPYAQGLAEKALISAAAGRWLAPDAIVVVEEHVDVEVRIPPPFLVQTRRAWGDTQVFFARYAPAGSHQDPP